MKLTDLEPEFLKLNEDKSMQRINNIKDADGIMFNCPKCQAHSIICWQLHVDENLDPKPGRWIFQGNNYEDLTLRRVISSSVLLTGTGCGAHFFVENGEVRLV